MQRTRRVIVDHLKRHAGAAVEQLAEAAGVAPITIRSHLAVLMREGLVRAEEVRGGRGRPWRRYFLTEAAEAHFPKRYGELAAHLLTGLSQVGGHDAVQHLVSHVAADMAATYRPRVDGKPEAERVAAIAAIIDEQGGAADWRVTQDGYVIYEHNCPYLSVSRCTDQVCEIDRQVVSALVGLPVHVPQRLRDGADSCAFVIGHHETPAG
jgi:predicted ArsR family transcriptional regulator